jgi:hypothetical protein
MADIEGYNKSTKERNRVFVALPGAETVSALCVLGVQSPALFSDG